VLDSSQRPVNFEFSGPVDGIVQVKVHKPEGVAQYEFRLDGPIQQDILKRPQAIDLRVRFVKASVAFNDGKDYLNTDWYRVGEERNGIQQWAVEKRSSLTLRNGEIEVQVTRSLGVTRTWIYNPESGGLRVIRGKSARERPPMQAGLAPGGQLFEELLKQEAHLLLSEMI
jgi:hypothetical protein